MHSQPEAGSQECVFGCIKYSMASMSEEVVLPLYLVLMQPQLEYCMILMIFECHFQITIQLFHSIPFPFYSFSILFCFVPLHFIQFPTRSMLQAEKDEQTARGLLFFSFTSGFCLSRNETSMRSCLAAGQTAGPAPL